MNVGLAVHLHIIEIWPKLYYVNVVRIPIPRICIRSLYKNLWESKSVHFHIVEFQPNP